MLSPEEIADAQVAMSQASEAAAPSVEAPENKAEMMEQIAQEESRLNTNIADNEQLLEALEVKSSAPASREESASRMLLNKKKITDAYDRVKRGIDELSMYGLTAAMLIMGSSAFAGAKEAALSQSANIMEATAGASHWNEIATKLVEGGMGTAAAVGGAWAISRAINWLLKQSKEEKNREEYQEGLNPQAA
ncbi:MAG: hypothetical protein P4M11_01730 [Candidatus Pacebacteria bacterium]|nr:hypothetical protein [Candidatus Paceibacterota bacterium]